MSAERKTITEWNAHFEATIMDDDGFRGKDWDVDLLTEDEYLSGMMMNTIIFTPKILHALENLKQRHQ